MATYTTTIKGTQKLYGFYGNGNGAVYTVTATNGTGVMKKFDVIRRPIRGGIPNTVGTAGSGQTVTYTENARFDFELEVWADVTTVGTFTATITDTSNGDTISMATYALDSTGNPLGLVSPKDGSVISVGKSNRLTRRSTIGTRIFGGRMGTYDNTTQKTFQITLGLAQKFDAVRVIFANSTTSSVGVGVCKVSVPPLASDINNNGGTWNTVTFGGAGTGTIPAAASAARRAFLVSDWAPAQYIERADGTVPLVTIRAYISTSGTIGVVGNGTDDLTNWATRPNGKIVAMRLQAGDQVTTLSGFSSTTNVSQCPIVGVQYSARGEVITVMGVGDSITEGRGTYLGEGFGVPAGESLSSMSGTAFEWCNLGWSGQSSNQFRDNMIDIASSGIYPDIMVMPCGSPNDDAGTITASIVTAQRSYIAQMLGYQRAMQVPIILWTQLPTNPSVKAYGATDALRVAHNTEVLTWANKGIDVLDFSTALSGITDGTGQVNMLAGSTTDNIHPNDAGNAILSPILAAKLREYIG